MASRIINDFKLTGGYLLTRPHYNWVNEGETEDDTRENAWRLKSHRLQRRRWQKVLKNSRNLR